MEADYVGGASWLDLVTEGVRIWNEMKWKKKLQQNLFTLGMLDR